MCDSPSVCYINVQTYSTVWFSRFTMLASIEIQEQVSNTQTFCLKAVLKLDWLNICVDRLCMHVNWFSLYQCNFIWLTCKRQHGDCDQACCGVHPALCESHLVNTHPINHKRRPYTGLSTWWETQKTQHLKTDWNICIRIKYWKKKKLIGL